LIFRLCDRLYRIEEEDLQKLLEEFFGVRLVGGEHKFIKIPDKIGAEQRIVLIADPEEWDLPHNIDYQGNGVMLYTEDDRCAFCYSSDTLMYKVFFAGTQESIRSWRGFLKRKPDTYAAIFLYIFNRVRAAQGLEEREEKERSFLEQLIRELREETWRGLEHIGKMTRFDWVVVLVYSSTTDRSVPVAASDFRVLGKLRSMASSTLSNFKTVIAKEDIVVQDMGQLGDDSCTCSVMRTEGAQQRAFLAFGRSPYETGMPRGILCLYRRSASKITKREKSLIRSISREIAGWIDEVDERIESGILENAIVYTAKLCADAVLTSVDERVFRMVLHKLSEIIVESVKKHIPNAFHQAEETVCGFFLGDTTIGNVPRSVVETEDEHKQSITLEMPYASNIRGDEWIVVVRENPYGFVVSSSIEILSVIRSHLYTWVFLLAKLVYYMVVVEGRRSAWMQRTLHEVRQPLQGLITVVSEIGRLAKEVSVPRQAIANYAEDMEVIILRLKVMLQIFNNLSGIGRIIPKPRDILMEGDVLRPIRRLLSGPAGKRGLKLSETIGFDVIPSLRADPDLLYIIFYNLLDNAIKYSDEGTTIEVFCSYSKEEYFVDVISRSPPILLNEVDEIFKEGYRGLNVRSTEFGLGRGLFMARNIAERIGCRVELVDRGKEHRKVRFRLCIPKEMEE
jgi:signal transduction histidine kinase